MTPGSPLPAPSLSELRSGFRTPSPDARPMMRWWWFGPDVDRAEIDRELQAMLAGGIGGVEVSYVYPLAAGSPELLSPEFCEQLRFAAERAKELGLRFDLTLGSGWSFGGPHISTEHAASLVHFERREIPPPAFVLPASAPFPGDHLLAAFLSTGIGGESRDLYTELPIIDGVVRVPDGTGPRQLVLAYARPTGQVVKRAAAGADGPVLDHYSAAATRAHIDHFAEPLLGAVPAELITSVFCDSLEVYAANWTPELFAEFERRRGYPLRPRLYQLIINTDTSDQLRIDYYRTLTELYEENFVRPWQQWAAGHGVKFRIQGYGAPPAAISSYRFADLCEGEGWGWQAIPQTRWATSAAHLLQRPVVSSETWTWNHSPTFRATALDLKGEAHDHLLAGINQFIGHGWPYSPPKARERGGLGWYFYAAGSYDDRNPWWPAMPELMGYLQRLSWLMRQGDPVADVLIYVPQADIYPQLGREVGGTLDLWKETRRYIDPMIPAVIRELGWNYDLVDDGLIDTLAVDHARVVILPDTTRIPDDTRGWLDRFAAAGGTILTVGGTELEQATPSSADTLGADLAALIAPDLRLIPNPGDVASVHRRLPEADVYLVINTGPHPRRTAVDPRVQRGGYEVWDPDSSTVIAAGATGEPIEIQLDPYQAVVLVLTDQDVVAVANVAGGEQQVTELGEWTVSFGEDDQGRTVTLPHVWEEDSIAVSGTATYRSVVDLDPSWVAGEPVLLDFGPGRPRDGGFAGEEGIRGNSYRVAYEAPVREIVRVIVNDQECGIAWAPPYTIDVTAAVQPGENRIVLEVSNTAAHALDRDIAIDEIVAESRQHYGNRFVMQDIDRALDGVRSGLMTVPVLRR